MGRMSKVEKLQIMQKDRQQTSAKVSGTKEPANSINCRKFFHITFFLNHFFFFL